MKLLMAIGGTGALVGGLYAGDALTAGQVYALPISIVRSQLMTMTLAPQLVQGTTASDGAKVVVESVGNSEVRWRVFSGGREVTKYTAVLEAEGPAATRVTLDRNLPSRDASMSDRLMSTKFMRGYADSLFEEQVSARLNRRHFDFQGAVQNFAVKAANDPAQMRELGKTMEGMFAHVSDQMKANSTYSAPPRSVRMQMKAATKPTVDLSDSR